VLRAVTEDYFRRSGLDVKLDHGVDNMAMAISLVASTRGLALMPAYAKNLLPESLVSRPLQGEPPMIDGSGRLQRVEHLAGVEAVPLAARRTGRAEPAALTPRSASPPGRPALKLERGRPLPSRRPCRCDSVTSIPHGIGRLNVGFYVQRWVPAAVAQ
jgi:hypothetical protein